tara:strand:- start:1159 stop:1464 length:306 start_codon:yes stop_codon:yes gene_type:complete
MILYREAEELSDSWVEYLDKLEELADLAGTILQRGSQLYNNLDYYGMPEDAQRVNDIMESVNGLSTQVRETRSIYSSINGDEILDIYEEVSARDDAAQERR